MRIAIPTTNGRVDGPGEGEDVLIYEINGDDIKLVEKYENPALKATAARGARMLKSALDKGVNAVIVAEIGPPGVRLLKGKAKIYLAEGLTVEEALEKFKRGELQETDKPTHEEHHHEF
ncbi:NifB/NifX family molybdenum-iron cluster-binding protein [Acidianus sp. HS-5]|uniref:NifB/NifX family molybdenum-iron cluster-binding protein n=1 Tax=Acidianus sp. HS-5 TaxID=2886040 RepID=UPI001F23887B|nr:NifB/NifX family molybdenum-iron cluster-binding protein [Acidianus sp. HS-5]BDC18015.1 diguanylate cyclase [Acidianus sp. HS-5]